MYITYELVSKDNDILIYRYYPCGSETYGEVWFNPTTNEYGEIKLEENDNQKRFLLMMYSAIRRMISQNKIEDKGILAHG